ncbi:hypothetical protein ACJIZ3_007290 [Penstemon smallii]|uniref:Trichome birefringence-like N-terminal domain-containing protein n=1 Tax=Penstemon smallii TaxID=265156 RepID=A0ABD3SA42_9LAMI
MGSSFFATFLVIFSLLNYNINGKVISQKGCDIFQGKWVYDNSYPLYNTKMCPFIENMFECQENSRPDKDYMKYRWQPRKKLMFVGDSLSLNQWQSLTCLLHVAVPQAKYISKRTGALSNFTFPAYNVSLLFLRDAFLVDIVHERRGRVLRLDSISTSKIWGRMDIMIFDSWHWWLHTGRKQPWDLIVDGNTTTKDMNRMVVYEKALNTWAKWIDSNVNPTKSKVFFQGVSPDHASGQIGAPFNKNCDGQTKLLGNPGGPHPAELVLEKVVEKMVKPVYLLNITTLSQLRIDGHPSVYGNGHQHNYSDCTHWCLAGVPDIWNELFYAAL